MPVKIELFVHSLQATYGSEQGPQYGNGKGKHFYTINLALDEFIREVKVGFAQVRIGTNLLKPKPGLCYLQFTSNRRTYGPYDGHCDTTVVRTHTIASGLAYFNGHGGVCIEGLTLNYFQ